MARFIYRMQSILNIKLKTEDQARMEFGTARHRLDLEYDRLEILREDGSNILKKEEDCRKIGLVSEKLSITENM